MTRLNVQRAPCTNDEAAAREYARGTRAREKWQFGPDNKNVFYDY